MVLDLVENASNMATNQKNVIIQIDKDNFLIDRTYLEQVSILNFLSFFSFVK